MTSSESESARQRQTQQATITDNESGRGAYSLLLLFYLTTMAAILVAASRLALDNALFTLRAFALGCVIVGTYGAIIGSIVGQVCTRGVRGLVIGLIVGLCLAPFATWIALVEAKHFVSASAIVFIGCWLVITLAVLGNRFQSQGPVGR